MTEPDQLDPEAQAWPIYFGLVEVLAEVCGPEIYKVEARQLPAWVRARLAAAPVPCAASPADLREADARIIQLETAIQGVLNAYGDKGWAKSEMCRRLRAALETVPRATGEGARDDTLRRNADSVSGGSEVDGAGTGAADRHQHRDIEPDRARAHDGRGHDAEAVDVDAQPAAPLAVSLDPHRPIAFTCKAQKTADPPQDCDWPNCGCDPYADKVLAALEEQAPGLWDMHRELEEARAELARLRGEATVRVEE